MLREIKRTYTDGEIVTAFRQSADQKAQIGILCTLCGATRKEILDVLTRYGEDVSEFSDEKAAHGNSWAEDEIAIMRELAEKGFDTRYIAKSLKRSYGSVRVKAENLGIEIVKTKNKRITPEIKDKMWRLSCSGIGAGEIASTMDIPYGTVIDNLRILRRERGKKDAHLQR